MNPALLTTDVRSDVIVTSTIPQLPPDLEPHLENTLAPQLIAAQPLPPKPPINTGRLHYAWIIAMVGSIAIFCGLGLGRFAFGMLLPSMSESLQLSHSQSGLLGFFNLVGYLIGVAMSPFLLPRIGTRATTTLCLFIISFTMLGMALNTSFIVLSILFLMTGIGSGGVVIPMLSSLVKWFQPSHRGIAAGVLMGGAGLGIVSSGFIVPSLPSITSSLSAFRGFGALQSWQVGWLLASLFTLGFAGLFWLVFINTPKQVGLQAYGSIKKTVDALTSKHPSKTSQSTPSQLKRSNLSLLLIMGIIYAIYGFTYMTYITFIVTSIVDKYQFTAQASGIVWAWIGFFSIFSGIIFGWISDKIGRPFGLALAFGFFAVAYLLVGLTDSVLSLYASITIFGITAWSIPGIMSAAVADYFGAVAAASILAMLTMSFSSGQAVGPALAGYLAEISGDFSSSYLLSAALAIIAVILSLWLVKKKPILRES